MNFLDAVPAIVGVLTLVILIGLAVWNLFSSYGETHEGAKICLLRSIVFTLMVIALLQGH